MLHLFGICSTCLLLLECCESNKTPILFILLLYILWAWLLLNYVWKVKAICAKQLTLSFGALERELPNKSKKRKEKKIKEPQQRKKNHKKAHRETLHAYLWLLAMYLLNVNNKLSLFMPWHAPFEYYLLAKILCCPSQMDTDAVEYLKTRMW